MQALEYVTAAVYFAYYFWTEGALFHFFDEGLVSGVFQDCFFGGGVVVETVEGRGLARLLGEGGVVFETGLEDWFG